MTTTTAPMTVGTRFEIDDSRPYHADGIKYLHTSTRVCEVTKTDSVGFDYVVTDVINEANRPDFAGTPTGGSVAWFAVPIYTNRGTLRILPKD